MRCKNDLVISPGNSISQQDYLVNVLLNIVVSGIVTVRHRSCLGSVFSHVCLSVVEHVQI